MISQETGAKSPENPSPEPKVESPEPAVRGWLLLLCLLLTIGEPVSLALFAGSRAEGILVGGSLTIALILLARLFVTATGIAAGIALWTRRPHAVTLTRVALSLSTLEAVARLSSRYGVNTAPPGTRLPLALAIVAYNGGWLAYLQKSRRVKATYG